jgi:predicted nuclease of predicted toxin-antitoxin system
MLYVFDENYSHRIADGLNKLESGNLKSRIHVEATHIITLTGKTGTLDPDVIEAVGKVNGIIFTKDKDFRHIKSYYPLYKKHKVGVTFFKQYKNGLTYWDNVKALVNKWEYITKATW